MSKISVRFGIALILLGLGFFVGTGSTAKTALIPAVLGAGIAVSGLLAMKPPLRPIFAHLALVLGALGMLAGLGMGVKTWVQSGPGTSALEQVLMGAICSLYVFLCVQSFRAARKARQA